MFAASSKEGASISGPTQHPRLSVVILTKNEEQRIARCLESVRWIEDIVVVDGMSTDRTVEICQQFGARVIIHPFEGSFAQERNLGLEQARGEWVLQIDADDIVTPGFRQRVARALAATPPHAAFKFRRKSYLIGRWMRYGGWYHYLPNLVRRGAVRYEGIVHERPVIQGTIGILDADIEHHPCEALGPFLTRHNRYTSLQAQELFRTLGRLTPAQIRQRLMKKPRKIFWKTYVKKQGYREGLHGLIFSIFFSGVELIKWAKYWELCEVKDANTQLPKAPASTAAAKSTTRRETLSVVLMTKNEEARLATCLDYVKGWADEIVVIDDVSGDRTVDIARRYTEKVFSFASEDNHDRQWNRGIERASGDWILHIDADEIVTPQLRAAIDHLLTAGTPHAAFELMRKNHFLGHPMRYGGWYHRHLVLFRRAKARCVGQGIHVKLQIDGSIGFLDIDIEHYPFSSLSQFLERQNHYTTVEARLMFQERSQLPRRIFLYQIAWRPYRLFLKSYRRNQGYREGLYGLVFALLYAFAHAIFWMKYWELTAAVPASFSSDPQHV